MNRHWHNWLSRLFPTVARRTRVSSRRSLRPVVRLGCEPLEDRAVPAATITIIAGASGTGTQDANLLADGQVLFADPDLGDNTISSGALEAVAGTTDIVVQALTTITFEDLGGTLSLQTGAGNSASFSTDTVGGGAISFVEPRNTLATSGGNLDFTAQTDLTLANLSAPSGAVSLTATTGAILDGNISADLLAMTAATGIGTSTDPIETTVSSLEAQTETGDIVISNTGDLTIGGVDDDLNGVQVIGDTGGISVTNAGSVFINLSAERVVAPGDVAVTASGSAADLMTGGFNLDFFGAVRSSGGAVSLTAGGNLFLGDATADEGGDVNAVGNITLSAGGDVIVYDTFVDIFSGGTDSTITVTAGGSIAVAESFSGGSRLQTISGEISLTTGTNGTAFISPNSAIAGVGVTISADIVDILGTIDAGSGVATIQPFTAGTGIDLGTETPGLLSLTNDELGLVTAGTLVIGDATAGDITITEFIVPSGTSQLELETGGAIFNANGGIFVSRLGLTASTGIGGGGVALLTAVENVEATTDTGGIFLLDVSGNTVTIGGVNDTLTGLTVVTSGDIMIDTLGSIDLADTDGLQVVKGGDESGHISLASITGDITASVDQVAVAVPIGDILLFAGQSILLGTAGPDFNNDVRASGQVTLVAGLDITISGSANIISDDFGNDSGGALIFQAGADINIVDTTGAGASIGAGGAAGAFVHLTAGLDATLNLSAPDAAAIFSTSGEIIIDADHVSISSTSGITAEVGPVSILPASNPWTIDLGGEDVFGSSLGLTDDELDRVFTPVLRIGDTLNPGDINFVGAISPANITTLTLQTGGAIVDFNDGDDVSVTNLNLQAEAGIGDFDSIDTVVSNLAASNFTFGDLNVSNTGALTIAPDIDGLSGILNIASGGSIFIVTVGPLDIAARVDATGEGDIFLVAMGDDANLTLVSGGAIAAIGGDGHITLDTSEATSGGTITINPGGSGLDLETTGIGSIVLDAGAGIVIASEVVIQSGDTDPDTGGTIAMSANVLHPDGTADVTLGDGIGAGPFLHTNALVFLDADPDRDCIGGTIVMSPTLDISAPSGDPVTDITLNAAADLTLTATLVASDVLQIHSCSNLLDDQIETTFLSANLIILSADGRIGGNNVLTPADVFSAATTPTARLLGAIDFDLTGDFPRIVIVQDAPGGNVQLRKVGSALTTDMLDLDESLIGPVNQLAVISSAGDFLVNSALALPATLDTLFATTGGYSVVFTSPSGAIANTTPGAATTLVASGSPTAAILGPAADHSPEISGSKVVLVTTGGDIGTSTAPLEINTNQLDGLTNGNGTPGGSAFITDTDNGLSVGQFNAGTGNVTLASRGNGPGATNLLAVTHNDNVAEIIANVVTLDTSAAPPIPPAPGSIGGVGLFFEVNANVINAITNNSSLWISEVGTGGSAGVAIGLVDVGTGTAFLRVRNGGMLVSETIDGTADVIGGTVNLSSGAEGGNFGTSAASPLEISATTLNANISAVGGSLFVQDTAGGLTVQRATTVNGDVSIETVGVAANLILGNASSATTVIGATGGTATLTATGVITSGATGVVQDVTAASFAATAGTTIGTLGTPLETMVETLAATAPAGVFVSNTGDLSIGEVGSLTGVSVAAGPVDVATASLLSVDAPVSGFTGVTLTAFDSAGPGQDLVVNADITSDDGSVTLGAGDTVIVNAGTTVSASGVVLLFLGLGDLDGTGGATIRGTLNSASIPAAAFGDVGDDTLLVDYAGGASLPDNLIFDGGDGTNTLQVSDAGLAIAQTYMIDETNVIRGGTNIGIVAGVQFVEVTAGSLGDTFNVVPSTTTAFTIIGGDPTPPTTPADTLLVALSGTTDALLNVSSDANGLSGSYTFGSEQPITFDAVEFIQGAENFLTVTVDDGQTAAIPGTAVTYTVTITNNSLLGITGITVADLLPAVLTGTSWTAVFSGTNSAGNTSGTGDIAETIDLGAGGSVTYTITGVIDSIATGTLSNTASATLPAGLTDSNPADNSATDSDTLTPTVDVTVTMTDGTTTATPGMSVTYTIVVSNTGPSAVSGVNFTDPFLAPFTLANWSSVAAGGATGNTATGSGNIADLLHLPSGASVTYTVTATIATTATGNLTSTATATLPAAVTDSNPGDESATDTNTLTPGSDVAVTISGPSSAIVGTPLTYTITVTNNGPSNATGVNLTHDLPDGVATILSVTTNLGTFTTTGGTLIAQFGTLAPGATATATVTINPTDGGAMPLSANTASTSGDSNAANNTTTKPISVAPYQAMVVKGPDNGGGPELQVLNANTGELIRSLMPFGAEWTSTISVAQGDLNGDGVPEIIAGAGPGGAPHVKIFDVRTGELLQSFFAYSDEFRYGVNVAAGDVDGDGFDDLITGNGAGPGAGPHVKAFSGADGTVLASFFAYAEDFNGGVRVAAGDLNGDGIDEIVTGAGGGGSAHVKVFDGRTLEVLSSFFGFDSGLREGVFVAVGDVNGDGVADIITGAGGGGAAHVKVFSGTDGEVIHSFFAFPPSGRDGVGVDCRDVNNDGIDDIIAISPSEPIETRVFDGVTLDVLGVFVG